LESITEDDRAWVYLVLQWICFARQDLIVEEIPSIWLVGNSIKPPLDPGSVLFHPEDIVGICCGLLILKATPARNLKLFNYARNDNRPFYIVQLAHFSVKEYLLSPRALSWRIDETPSHISIVQSSTAYFLHVASSEDASHWLKREDLLKAHPLATYAPTHTTEHLDCLDPRDHLDLAETVNLIFEPNCEAAVNKMQLLYMTAYTDSFLTPDLYPMWCEWSLVVAAKMGLSRIVEWLLSFLNSPSTLNLTWSLGITKEGPPIVDAAEQGHIEVVKLLLSAGADINQTGGIFGSSALFAASRNGHKEIVCQLLSAGADANQTGGQFGSALYAASENGHKEVVCELLCAGADVHQTGRGFESALCAASREGHKEIVCELLSAGADVNQTGGEFGSSLCAASRSGHKEIVCELLSGGADVNQPGRQFGSALGTTSKNNTVVHELLAARVDVSQTGEDPSFCSALHVAAKDSQEDIVQILLNAGADVHQISHNGESALSLAAVRGHTRVIQILLDAGADVNQWAEPLGSALAAAQLWGHYEACQLLIDAGAVTDTGSSVDVNDQADHSPNDKSGSEEGEGMNLEKGMKQTKSGGRGNAKRPRK
jgi:ankyrin repeat protein